MLGIEVKALMPGDFNGSGTVDGADFLQWQRGQSPNPVSVADLIEWQTNFGASASGGTGTGAAEEANVAVPEPATGVLALLVPLATIALPRTLRRPALNFERNCHGDRDISPLHRQARIDSMMSRKRCRGWLTPLLAWVLLPCSLSAALVQTGNVVPNVNTWGTQHFGYIGDTSAGSVTVNSGSLLASMQGYLGYNAGSAGTATVTGTGSKWNNNGGSFYVGHSGAGTLTIEAGGQVDVVGGFPYSSSYVGNFPGSTGTVLVTGAGSIWKTYGDSIVGDAGSGTLVIEAGGRVYTALDGKLGRYTHSSGVATVTGAGSAWIVGTLHVGGSGKGTLTISEGGLVEVPWGLTIDSNSSGNSFINMATGGMLALRGDADESLSQFLGLVQGTDAIRVWDDSLSDWGPIDSAVFGVDYTLEYLAAGDLAGYTLLTARQAISPGLAGDFDGNGVVEGSDFLVWQTQFGQMASPNVSLSADGNGDGFVNADDLAIWQQHFGMEAPDDTSTSAVPEPLTVRLALVAFCCCLIVRRTGNGS